MARGSSGKPIPWLERDSIIGFGIVACAIILAVGLQISAASGGGNCKSDPQYQKCLKQKGGSPKKCKPFWDKCMKKKCDAGWPKKLGGGSTGKTCNKDPECQSHCTEVVAGKKDDVQACCTPLVGPDENNPCPNKVNGQCVNSKPKTPGGGKSGQPPQGGDKSKGGDKGGGGGMPQPPQPPQGDKDKKQTEPDCTKNPPPPECPKQPDCTKVPKPWWCYFP